MIIDSLISFEKYISLHQSFEKVYNYLKENDLKSLPVGRHPIEEGNIWIKVSENQGRGVEDLPPVEVHDSFIDIHIVISGVETIGFVDRTKCLGKDVEYDEKEDVAYLKEAPEVFVSYPENNFVICFPKDGHAPMIGNGVIRKAVIKVRV